MTHENEMPSNDDPFNGYASCPDRCRVYISHSSNNQQVWMQKSENIIREFILKIDSFKNFHDAYAFLAHRRHDVAKELKQKMDEGKTDYYGTFRKEDNHFRQSISAGDGEHFWKWQKKKIFELVQELVTSIKNIDLNNMGSQSFFEDEYKICLMQRVIIEGMEATYYCITIKFTHEKEVSVIKHMEHLSTIELYEFDDQPSRDLIRIEYAPINNLHVKNHYQIANHYYQNLLDWQTDDTIEKFFGNAARLFYLMAHLLPIKKGNCAVMEWMLHALAFRKGIELGHFNFSEGISWDFKAILTPNQDDYIQWYTEKLFTAWSCFDSHDTRLFTFRHNV